MDPLQQFLDSTKKEPKEEIEDDGMREINGLASSLVSAGSSEDSNIMHSSEESETDDVVNSQSDVVEEREEASSKCKKASKAKQGHKRRCGPCSPFKCVHCDYGCHQKTNLAKHERTHFGQQFECPQCAMKLRSAEALRQHMELHTGQTFTCERCGHKSNTKAVADQHQRYGRCNKESTFRCDHCDFRTSTEFLLLRHLKRRNSSTGRCRPPGKAATATYYTCSTCRFTTPSKLLYKRHILRRAKKQCMEPSRNRMIPSAPLMFMRAQCRFNFVDPMEADQAGPSNNIPARQLSRRKRPIVESDDSDE